MQRSKDIVDELKSVLDNIHEPEHLNDHPWARSQIVHQYLMDHPSEEDRLSGHLLLAALEELFRQTMPSTPPRRGKRLDTAWGQFGMLAALYFAPLRFGLVAPKNLRDAWGRIDQVITLYMFGKSVDEIPEEELSPYLLLNDENEVTPPSTISNWHISGLERLADVFLDREKHLSSQWGEPSLVLEASQDSKSGILGLAVSTIKNAKKKLVSRFQPIIQLYRQHTRRVWILGVLVLVVLLGWKTVRVFQLTLAVKDEISQLRALTEGELTPEILVDAGPLLVDARHDILALRRHVRPFLWLGDLFAWLPVYGGDLADADHLVVFAAGLIVAGDEIYQSVLPVLHAQQNEAIFLTPSLILDQITEAESHLFAAQESMEGALRAYAEIDIQHLSPKTRPFMEKVDPYLPLIQDGISAGLLAPKVLGAEGYGPQTYLVLLQNEDELRATGGFITAVGEVTVENGEIISMSVEDSYAIDDLSKSTFTPPWQLTEFMQTGLWWIRDSNWPPDFPTAAAWAERMYAHSGGHAVDGVIAVDQEAIRLLVMGVDYLHIEGVGDITADNLIEYMRAAKDPTQCQGLIQEYRQECKGFMQPLAEALILKVQDEAQFSWKNIATAMLQALDERHVLVQIDEPDAANMLAARGWDGGIHPGEGDYLMVVDSNMGFNKVNAVMETQLIYQVDLSDWVLPTASLIVAHHNPTSGSDDCVHKPLSVIENPEAIEAGYQGLIEGCYWDYLRVYLPEGTVLLEAIAQSVPGDWMISEEPVPARIDDLTNTYIMPERIEGIQAFGTFLVVPMGKRVETEFRYQLPASVLISANDGRKIAYQLHVQKQPGTKSVPISLQVQLPKGAELVYAEPEGISQADIWQIEWSLDQDLDVELVFGIP